VKLVADESTLMWNIDVLLDEYAWYRRFSNYFSSKTKYAISMPTSKTHGKFVTEQIRLTSWNTNKWWNGMSPDKLLCREIRIHPTLIWSTSSSTSLSTALYDCIHYDFTILDQPDLFACHAAIYIGGQAAFAQVRFPRLSRSPHDMVIRET
jgi:hypothetical protein